MVEKTSEIFLAFLQRNGMVAIVILAVLAVRLLLRRCPKKYSYGLWAVVGIRMLFDLPLTSRFSLFNLFSLSEKRADTVRTVAENGGGSAGTVSTAAGGPLTAEPAAPPAAGHMTTAQTVLSVLFFVWILGMALMLSYGIYSYVKCRRLVRTAVILERKLSVRGGGSRAADGKHKNRRTVGVWECDGIASPFVLGVFRPRIYLPFGMEERERQYILAHECCHVRRHDALWKLLAFVLLAVYWCNPLAWAAFFFMVRDMEMSCDEAVVASLGSEGKKGYSESLLAFATERHPYSFAPVAFGEGDAAKRIKNVLHFKKPQIWVTLVAVVLIAVVALCCLTDQEVFACGTYSYEYNQESGTDWADFTITFHEDGTYNFYEGPFSSYIGLGTYSVENGVLTMKEDEEAGFGMTNRFRVEGDRLYFMAEESDNFVYVKVKDGQSFLLSEEETDSQTVQTDVEVEQGVRKWVTAFCERDVNTIKELASEEAQADLEEQGLSVGGGFGWSSPWPWGEGQPVIVSEEIETAEILYYALDSEPHVTVWREILHYTCENGEFTVTGEELQMYDAISTAWEFDTAYLYGINGTAMDYRENDMMEVLNGHIAASGNENEPLLDPAGAARYLLNLSDDADKVQLSVSGEETGVDGEVLVQITFPEEGAFRQVAMVQPWGADGIWIPQDRFAK